ncbi:thioredoxin family protein [Desulfurivibrio alkaliphilus]|uniref:Redox-active disulfide protein 2 n=1 Tax=Desulfurivibrio alkaliphilus (strain DSM 19089 / UNIQEM U267 / AHT2) TaxID=589865 RepID=D6Z048_DESAT|nr:thioredoxin family protein [Desulfurivibrio alkaliphilus]ADH87081.1 redox-active disulfide protein 2 [Desulfurivibrio alkaliphilus AHT 2]
MESPLQRSLKVGRAVIGLLGLDVALGKALADQDHPREQILERLYRQVAEQNYIPPGREELYHQALAQEYDRLQRGEQRQDGTLQIRILGPGCVSCNRLGTMVLEVMSELGIAADILQIQDPDEIGRFGMPRTPALVINDQLLCAGRQPAKAKLEEWLREAADQQNSSNRQ